MFRTLPRFTVDNRSKCLCARENNRDAWRLAGFPPGQVGAHGAMEKNVQLKKSPPPKIVIIISLPLYIFSLVITRYDHQTRLLPYVLNAIADEAKVSAVVSTFCCVPKRSRTKLSFRSYNDGVVVLSKNLPNTLLRPPKAVSATAIETLSKCGAEYEREHQDDIIERRQFGIDGDSRANHSKPLPRPFSGRPRIGDRLYVRSNTRRFLMVSRR